MNSHALATAPRTLPVQQSRFRTWLRRFFPEVSLQPLSMARPGRKLFLNGKIVHIDR